MGASSREEGVALLRKLVDAALQHQPGPDFWAQRLPPEHRAVACSTYFLLGTFKGDDQDKGGEEQDGFETNSVEYFITHTLTRLVRQLSQRTERIQVTYRGQARGRILWPATFKARYSGDSDETRFVCREVRRLYDTPENQLLKHVVQQLQLCFEQVPESIRSGSCYRSQSNDDPFISNGPRLALMESALRVLRQHALLRQVSLPERIDDSHLLSAETARLVEYAEVALFYGAFEATVVQGRWEQLARIGRRNLPLPLLRAGDEFWFPLGAAVLRS